MTGLTAGIGACDTKAQLIDATMALAWLFERKQPSDRLHANHLLAACGETPDGFRGSGTST